MRIIKQGRYPRKKWEGMEIECPKCGSILHIETRDILTWDYKNYFAYCPLAVCDHQFKMNGRSIPRHVFDRADRKAQAEEHRLK